MQEFALLNPYCHCEKRSDAAILLCLIAGIAESNPCVINKVDLMNQAPTWIVKGLWILFRLNFNRNNDPCNDVED